MTEEPVLSIVLPAFNEEENIETAIRKAVDAVAPLVDNYQIVVVDDGSSDSTPIVLQRLQEEMGSRLVLVTHEENKGYGIALRSGFKISQGSFIFYTDSDCQFNLSELESFLPEIEKFDFILGYRVGRQDGELRLLVSNGYNALASFAFGLEVRDLNCSFKLFRREVLLALDLEDDHFFIDTEIVVKLYKAGCSYKQKGVRHYPRTRGRSTVRWTDVPLTFAALLKLWVKLR